MVVSSLPNCFVGIARSSQIWQTRRPGIPSCPCSVHVEMMQFLVPRNEVPSVCAHKADTTGTVQSTVKNSAYTGTHKSMCSPHRNMNLANSLFLPSVISTDKSATVHMKMVLSCLLTIFPVVFLPSSPWSPSIFSSFP